MTTWPSAPFPQLPDRDGWRETFPKNVVRTPNDAGPAKQRRRFTSGVRPMSVTITMTGAETEQFDTFWTTDCGEGALPFDWTNPRTGLTKSYQFHGDNPPSIINIGGDTWKVSFLLEQLP